MVKLTGSKTYVLKMLTEGKIVSLSVGLTERHTAKDVQCSLLR